MALDLISCMRSFVAVVEHGGYANASRHIYISPPVITKQIKLLEHNLKRKLFYRTTRRIQLTEAGEVYLSHVRGVLQQIKEAQDALIHLESGPQGTIRVGVPTILNSMFFAKNLTSFLEKYPHINCELTTEVSPTAITDDLCDIIITAIDFQDKQLVKQLLLTCSRGVYASPAYIKKHGQPKTIVDLKNHNCLNKKCTHGFHLWEFSNNKKATATGNFVSDSGIDIYFACLNGLGLMYSTSIAVLDEVESKRLIKIDLDEPPTEMDIYIYYRPVMKESIIKLLVDHVIDKTKKCRC